MTNYAENNFSLCRTATSLSTPDFDPIFTHPPQQVIEEHGTWLAANNARQISNYADFVRARWPGFSEDFEDQPGAKLVSYGGGDNPHGREALADFNPSAAALVLENEVREVVRGRVFLRNLVEKNPFGGLLGVVCVPRSVAGERMRFCWNPWVKGEQSVQGNFRGTASRALNV